jgi:hypothetical protein
MRVQKIMQWCGAWRVVCGYKAEPTLAISRATHSFFSKSFAVHSFNHSDTPSKYSITARDMRVTSGLISG